LNHPGVKANPNNIPKHIAIIMDGNGRWAVSRGLSRTTGHRKGVEAVRNIISGCQKKKIQVLTLFAFGVENWKRPSKEVRNLFRIFFLVLRKDIARLHENNIKLRIIGDRSVFNRALNSAIDEAQDLTKNNSGLILNIAVNYSGRWDLLNAMQKVLKNQTGATLAVTEEAIAQELSLHGLPEPDLFIRTGGVQRISNFILWELAYTELYFSSLLWPDFNENEFERALNDFSLRERRFGLTGEQL
jgi:undecaprenyl diphosphate synthase